MRRVLVPAPKVLGRKTRLKSRFCAILTKFTPHCVCLQASVAVPFLGDELGVTHKDPPHPSASKWAKIVAQTRLGDVFVSTQLKKINRSNGNAVDRVFMVGSNGIVLCDTSYRLKYFISFATLQQVTVSSQLDDTFVLHVGVGKKKKETRKGDHMLVSARVIEIVTRVFIAFQIKEGRRLDVTAADEFEIVGKKGVVSVSVAPRESGNLSSTPGLTSPVKRKGRRVTIDILDTQHVPLSPEGEGGGVVNTHLRGGSIRQDVSHVFDDICGHLASARRKSSEDLPSGSTADGASNRTNFLDAGQQSLLSSILGASGSSATSLPKHPAKLPAKHPAPINLDLVLEADDDTGLLSESEEYLDSTGLDSKQTDLGEYLGVAPRTPLTPVPPTATLTATLAQPGTATLTATLVQQQSESSADAVDGTCGADGRGIEPLHSTLRRSRDTAGVAVGSDMHTPASGLSSLSRTGADAGVDTAVALDASAALVADTNVDV